MQTDIHLRYPYNASRIGVNLHKHVYRNLLFCAMGHIDSVNGNIAVPHPTRQCSVLLFRVNYMPTVITTMDSLRPRDANIHRQSRTPLVQITACRLFVALNHYLNQYWNVVNCNLRNKLQWIFNRNLNIFHSRTHNRNCRLRNCDHLVSAAMS